MRHLGRRALAPIVALGLASCASSGLKEVGTSQLSTSLPIIPPIIAESDGQAHMSFRVMTYNVAGLPWPFMKKRNAPLAQIGTDLSAMRDAGTAPDIIFIQEGFRRGVAQLVENSEYPYWVRGPGRRDKPTIKTSHVSDEFISNRLFFKGERIGKLMGSGLIILSRYPIIKREAESFGSHECAGYDCAANKGVVWAEVRVPGLPEPVQLMTLHLNARKAAKVSFERSLEAHNAQFAHVSEFVETQWNPAHPLIFGGDFNLSRSENRFAYIQNFDDGITQTKIRENELVLPFCREDPACEISNSELTDKPLTDYQDWQGYSSGQRVLITPRAIRYAFDGPDPRGHTIRGKPQLSDHKALIVDYDLAWTP